MEGGVGIAFRKGTAPIALEFYGAGTKLHGGTSENLLYLRQPATHLYVLESPL
jgi:hypothetical protein